MSAQTSAELHARFTQHADHELGVDAEGYMYASDETMSWRITECCGASAKGSMGDVVCRACYQLIDEEIGALPVVCEYFALCTNVATTMLAHPVLGAVPTCTRCAEKIEKLS